MAPRKQHNLFSKGDVASILGVTSQTFANWQSRDAKFPEPTFSNRAGNVALYSPDDVQKINEYVSKAERERLDARDRAIAAALAGGDIQQLDGQSTIDDAEVEFQAAAPDKAPEPVAEPKTAPVAVKADTPKGEAKPEPSAEVKPEAKPEPVKEAPKAEAPKADAKADDKDKELVGAGAPATPDAKTEEKKAPLKRGSVLNKR